MPLCRVAPILCKNAQRAGGIYKSVFSTWASKSSASTAERDSRPTIRARPLIRHLPPACPSWSGPNSFCSPARRTSAFLSARAWRQTSSRSGQSSGLELATSKLGDQSWPLRNRRPFANAVIQVRALKPLHNFSVRTVAHQSPDCWVDVITYGSNGAISECRVNDAWVMAAEAADE